VVIPLESKAAKSNVLVSILTCGTSVPSYKMRLPYVSEAEPCLKVLAKL